MLMIIVSILSQITGSLFIFTPLDIYSHCTCLAPNNRYIKISDGETFISADDLRINLWNLEITNQSFNIVDVKPEKMEDLSGKPWFTVPVCSLNATSCVNCYHIRSCRGYHISRVSSYALQHVSL